MTHQSLAFYLKYLVITLRIYLNSKIFIEIFCILSHYQFAVLVKNTWSIIVDIRLAGRLEYIMSNSIILALYSKT